MKEGLKTTKGEVMELGEDQVRPGGKGLLKRIGRWEREVARSLYLSEPVHC